jgi:hypothetical protein
VNLHATVRAAIQSINPDITAAYLQSTGYTVNAAGQQQPSYAAPVNVRCQVQPPSGRDLRHMEFLNIQGTTRTVFLYSNPQAIDRVDARGGDLLQFPQFSGAPVDNWLVTATPETWDVGTNQAAASQLPTPPPSVSGWTKLYVVLQTDRPGGETITTQDDEPITTQQDENIVTDVAA